MNIKKIDTLTLVGGLFLICLLAVLPDTLSAEGTARILQVNGDVQLDKEGKNIFVRAEKGDALAANAVIKTAKHSSALISVQNQEFLIYPLSKVTISFYYELAARKEILGLKRYLTLQEAINQLIAKIFSVPANKGFGTREGPDETQVTGGAHQWVAEKDWSALLTEVNTYFRLKNFYLALSLLEQPDGLSQPLTPAEQTTLALLKGTCYINLDDFLQAEKQFLIAYEILAGQSPVRQGNAGEKMLFPQADSKAPLACALFNLGFVSFSLGKEQDAAGYLNRYLTSGERLDEPFEQAAQTMLAAINTYQSSAN